MAFGEEIFLGR